MDLGSNLANIILITDALQVQEVVSDVNTSPADFFRFSLPFIYFFGVLTWEV